MESRETFPELDSLLKLNAEVAAALEVYKSANSPTEKSDALDTVARSSQRIINIAKDPRDAFTDFLFQPLANACVRICLSLGLFEQLSETEARSSAYLAELTKSDPALVARLLRTLFALDIVKDEGNGRYLHTPFSLLFVEKSRKAYSIWMWDQMAHTSSFVGPYFDRGVKETPTDSTTAPFSFAHHAEGTHIFDVIKKIGVSERFVDAMSGSSVLCAKEAVSTYAFDKLDPGQEDVVLVDVGGNNGQTLDEIKRAYPGLKGRMILQDLQSVLDGGTIPNLDAEVQPYDFFAESQPVKGAAAYFYQRIFHDWSDNECQTILKSLHPAMTSHSKLLICDTVLPDVQPPTRKVLRDINMLLIAGKERSEQEWKEMLESAGFSIAKIHGLHNTNNSIIEAVLQSP